MSTNARTTGSSSAILAMQLSVTSRAEHSFVRKSAINSIAVSLYSAFDVFFEVIGIRRVVTFCTPTNGRGDDQAHWPRVVFRNPERSKHNASYPQAASCGDHLIERNIHLLICTIASRDLIVSLQGRGPHIFFDPATTSFGSRERALKVDGERSEKLFQETSQRQRATERIHPINGEQTTGTFVVRQITLSATA
jgi:hypothetical protein